MLFKDTIPVLSNVLRLGTRSALHVNIILMSVVSFIKNAAGNYFKTISRHICYIHIFVYYVLLVYVFTLRFRSVSTVCSMEIEACASHNYNFRP